MDEKTTPPVVSCIDDDELMHDLVVLRLKNLHCKVNTFFTPEDFLKSVKFNPPDLCLIDLDIGRKGVGYLIIQAIRKALGEKIPVIVLSSHKDSEAIAHALEVGANDFIPKPPSRDTFAKKIEQYLKSNEAGESEYLRTPPKGMTSMIVTGKVTITDLAENGFYLQSPFLISKGTLLTLKGKFIEKLTDAYEIKISITRNWVEKENQTFGAFAEFVDDNHSQHLLMKARRFIVNLKLGENN